MVNVVVVVCVAGSYSGSVYNFLRRLHVDFHPGWVICSLSVMQEGFNPSAFSQRSLTFVS